MYILEKKYSFLSLPYQIVDLEVILNWKIFLKYLSSQWKHSEELKFSQVLKKRSFEISSYYMSDTHGFCWTFTLSCTLFCSHAFINWAWTFMVVNQQVANTLPLKFYPYSVTCFQHWYCFGNISLPATKAKDEFADVRPLFAVCDAARLVRLIFAM